MRPDQCRAARELLGWSELQLAVAAGCSTTTVKSVEAGRNRPHRSTLSAIRRAFEEAGIRVPAAGIGHAR